MKLQFLEAGEIVSTHGVRGEMKVLPWSDGPDFLLDFDRVCIQEKEYEVESCRVQKTCNLLKLKGIDTIDDAQLLRGKTVQIYRCDAPDDIIFVVRYFYRVISKILLFFVPVLTIFCKKPDDIKVLCQLILFNRFWITCRYIYQMLHKLYLRHVVPCPVNVFLNRSVIYATNVIGRV